MEAARDEDLDRLLFFVLVGAVVEQWQAPRLLDGFFDAGVHRDLGLGVELGPPLGKGALDGEVLDGFGVVLVVDKV